MDSPLLRHLFSRALRASLASPLVLAGCDGIDLGGVDTTGYSAPVCEGSAIAVSGLSPAVPADFVQRVEDELVVDPLSIEPADYLRNEDDPSEEGP